LETVRRFRFYVIRLSAALTIVLALVASLFDFTIAEGLAIGGLAGSIGFLLMTRSFEVANASEDGVKSRTRKWRDAPRRRQGASMAARLILYAIALYIAYNLDTVHVRGFLAAGAGLFIVCLAVMVVGVAGWDLKEPE
jgi:uncharacterized membrane protein